MASNGYPQQGESTSPATTTMSAGQYSGSTAQPPDQVGWLFVEQYYTTLGETPDKLSLFYGKKSSLVWGTEGETLPMIQGRSEISERIKSLHFKDCKVRVTNVDSQASAGGGILIQVMGDMIKDQGPCQRFTQTFFLAEQPNGYFVLNDIFRYLKEEEEVFPEEEEAAPEPEAVPVEESPVEEPEPVKESEDTSVPTEAEPEPEPTKPEEPVSVAPAVPEISAAVPTVNEITNGTPVVEEAESVPEPMIELPEAVPEPTEEALPSLPAPQAESTDVTPAQLTPVATPPPQQIPVEKPAAPVPPPAPARPATWASLLGSNSRPTVPVASPAPQATQAPPVSQQPVQTSQSNTAAAASTSSGHGWQSVSDSSRRYAKPTSIAGAGDLQTQAFIKYGSENIDVSSLKDVLGNFGTIKNVEMIRERSCAFVEFDTPASCKAAKVASPLRIGGQNIYVEERRPGNRVNRPGSYGPRSQAGGQRGGERQGQGRGAFQRVEGRFDGRGDSREGGRGSARGGRATPRGSHGAAATN
ncbi:hypothetical protein L211DRAFT_834562 [Terfezia boudieri ATCC MYA-4762]|uniref:NTF2-domain-containing protein n=1 Tax=Terfezia boudieri ATCC MYA-4762 TaxID=1051890 RepID=A0A3N4M2V7_9PEZI|nr:hypothetical protein L211DRAFT_834562 [Terfezia boudieri ATCC MYA-4762]